MLSYPIIALPPLPGLISEFAALFPLVKHLSSLHRDHQIVGETALLCKLHVGLFPKLGFLTGLSRYLSCGSEFLDRASSRGLAGSTVWDVSWGSVFPCANGGLIDLVTLDVLSKPDIVMIGCCSQERGIKQSKSERPWYTGKWIVEGLSRLKQEPLKGCKHFSRPQVLHVLHFTRKQVNVRGIRGWSRMMEMRTFEVLRTILIVLIAGFFSLVGAYGCAIILVNGLICRWVSKTCIARRPVGYLDNNEDHDAWMLRAIHANSTTWHLYTGDRGVVDWILNKTMIEIPATKFHSIAARLLKMGNANQLMAMAYVAAHKGWDGVFLLAIMVADLILLWPSQGTQAARKWRKSEGIEVRSKSFAFTGRTIMIGAIQKLSGSKNTVWMNEILVPHPRREVWLSKLINDEEDNAPLNVDRANLTERDLKKVNLTAELSRGAATCISEHFRETNCFKLEV
ncbi:uncharacterized protein PV09_07038 [Verruconis gallopava]|uniref:Uncharacterized protein n=1 Tax=Verruconis gallopava TaxID=253628 RepID=A0A0D1YL83_9PEZI|nr:uncharacterized protein PV09_07038 [Verruconis gallopava]KIW01562.1 hypothetical protein PV09_07038 [Verruconis gallopava]